MPFARPSLTALRNQAVPGRCQRQGAGLDGLLRNAVLRVLAWVMSGLAYSVYGYLDWIARRVRAVHCDRRIPIRLGGIDRRLSEGRTPASGTAQFTGATGLVLPSGAPLTRRTHPLCNYR